MTIPPLPEMSYSPQMSDNCWYAITEVLSEKKRPRILEWGSGASTLPTWRSIWITLNGVKVVHKIRSSRPWQGLVQLAIRMSVGVSRLLPVRLRLRIREGVAIVRRMDYERTRF